ncbi:MAG: tRNA (adenosine(37)-N6)-threonylcarbamoyltransferase complex ATPase subunit type 1 TsaE [Clostridiaceae bacterium]
MKIVTNSVEETMKVGMNLAKILQSGDVVLLNGDLGAGKTHLVKGIALGLGIDETVTSPTFTIENKYKGNEYNLNHFDVYRVNDEDEILDIGFEESIYSEDISVIEWSDLILGILPEENIDIRITRDPASEDRRIIQISFNPINKDREDSLNAYIGC